jgi:hypothetical protein
MGPETVERAEGAEAGRCGVCGEGSRFERLRLHAGALYLYFKDGRWFARADIDHVYHRCRKGLIDNLRLLKRLYDHLYTNGRPSRDGRLRLLGVSKIKHIEVEKVESLEALHYSLEPVPEEVVRETLEE